jgi:site-specific recombinase XerC
MPLILLPDDLVRRAQSRGRQRCAAARDVQIAVAVEIQLVAALRSANLAGLQLGKHVLIGARADRVTLVIDEHETKNESLIDQELPPESSRLVRLYVERYLPVLGPAGGCYLFPGRAGGAMQPAALGKRITAAIRKATGCDVNLHLLRHLGAKRHLDRHPGEYGVVRRVLGHKSAWTTTVYTGMESAAAARHFDAGLLAGRRAAESRLGRRKTRF